MLDLSVIELAVANGYSQGMSDEEIGLALGISRQAAHAHGRRIRYKLGLRSRAQVAAAYTRDLVGAEQPPAKRVRRYERNR